MNSVSCLAWVKRGAAKRNPDRVQLEDEELKNIIEKQGERLKNLDVESESDENSEEELPHKSAKQKDENKVNWYIARLITGPRAHFSVSSPRG